MANKSETFFASAARTADVTVDKDNVEGRGVLLVVDVTVASATPSVVPTIRARDEEGNYNNPIFTGTAFTGTGQFTYLVYPGVTSADFDGTDAASIALPREWQLFMNHADADSITYSVRGHYIN